MTPTGRKPRIALMGEFSAGKSTLSNLLLGARPLPEKVTATRLSPVWMSHGTNDPYRVDVDGSEEPVDIDNLEAIDVDATRVIRLFFEADILEVCDLIDFPGISDPNMSSEVWQRMVGEVDAVLWCTHATQAWRQSEAAVWDTIPEEVRAVSTLLITRFDKLTTDRDKYRVLARLGKETKGLFGAMFPISLTEALAAGDDFDAFEDSGGGPFLEHLIPLIDDLAATVAPMNKSIYLSATAGEKVDLPEPIHTAPASRAPAADPAPHQAEAPAETVAEAPLQPAQPEPTPAPIAVQAEAPEAQEPAEAVSHREPGEAPTDALARVISKSKPANLSNFAASLSGGPAVTVDSARPVIDVDSAEPVAAEAAEDRILPRRIRAEGGGRSLRPARPQAVGQVVDMTDAPQPQARSRPTSKQKTVQLRSIFNENPENSVDGAATS